MCLLYSRVVRNVKWTLGSLALGSCAKGRAPAVLHGVIPTQRELRICGETGHHPLAGCFLGTELVQWTAYDVRQRKDRLVILLVWSLTLWQYKTKVVIDTRWVYSKYAVLLNTADRWWQMALVSHLRDSALDWLTADFLKSDIWHPLYWGFERHFCTAYVTMLLVIKWLF